MSQPPEQQPRPEADVPTPPRGFPQPGPATPALAPAPATAPEPAPVWGAATPPPSLQGRRSSRARVLQIVALVVGLVGTGWISTDYFRTVWLDTKPADPVAVDQAGVARLEGLSVSLVEATDLGAAPSLPDTDWQPPAGFHAWRVVLDSESTNDDIVTCDVALVDGGRHFMANYFVDSFVDGYEWNYSCGLPEPDDDVPAQQALLVLVPADAEPRTVQITSTGFTAGYIELEIG